MKEEILSILKKICDSLKMQQERGEHMSYTVRNSYYIRQHVESTNASPDNLGFEHSEIYLSGNEIINYLKWHISNIEKLLDEYTSLYKKTTNKHFAVTANIVRRELADLTNNIRTVSTTNSIYSILETIEMFYSQLEALFSRYRNSPLYSQLFSEQQTVVIVGKNGAGKSSLLEDVKQDFINNIVAIPANKLLMVDNSAYTESITDRTLDEKLSNQPIKYSRSQSYRSDTQAFSALLDYVRREHQSKKADYEKSEESKLDKIKQVYSALFPELDLVTRSMESEIVVKSVDSADEYSINRLSDGERSALYYIMNCFLAKEESIIIVDEPETHLHPSLCNQLWDKIIEARPDCRFIFISHNPYFIEGRGNSRIVWCRKYIGALSEDNQLEEVEDNVEVPKSLYVELLGAKKPMLLCEGDESSWDYKLYNILYSDSYIIKPVNGHLDVINNVKAIRKMNNEAIYGIIDRDAHSDEEIQSLLGKGVATLPVCEIEMMFLYECVIDEVISDDAIDIDFQKREISRETILDKFRDQNQRNLDKLVAQHLRYWVDHNKNIQSSKDTQGIINEVKNLTATLNTVCEEKNRIQQRIQNIFESGSHEEILEVCSLKWIAGGAILLPDNYRDIALRKISKSEELQEFLRSKINLRFNDSKQI